MPQYLAPGVYVEEVPSSVQPIAGVGTSTAAFIGQVEDDVRLPPRPGGSEPYELPMADVPQLITSWEGFRTRLGDFQEGNSTLAHAVYGFFNNGGTRCWVARFGASLTAANVTSALERLATIDEISLVAVPGAEDAAIQTAVIDHCRNLGDRFAILDGQDTAELTPEAIQGEVGNSDSAAMYYPRIQVFDPVSGAPLAVPPSGHIAGVYARVDTLRGVHKAPANEVIRGALGVQHRLSRADQAGLNPAGINVIRDLDGNVTVWGARTLGGDANGEWKYVNVRRLFLFLRESIDQGTRWVIFEPNDPSLWARVTRNVSAFLTNVWRSGALFGATPQETFYVRCDASNNPPEVRDLGQLVVEVGLAAVRPAEFLVFRISQWAGPGR